MGSQAGLRIGHGIEKRFGAVSYLQIVIEDGLAASRWKSIAAF